MNRRDFVKASGAAALAIFAGLSISDKPVLIHKAIIYNSGGQPVAVFDSLSIKDGATLSIKFNSTGVFTLEDFYET